MPKDISFLFKEVITCGAVLSTFELAQALKRWGVDAHIISDYNNKELEDYFGIEIEREPKGVTVAISPKRKGEWAYIRTKDDRWKNHISKKIVVSKYLQDWYGGGIIIGNGTHERFYDMGLDRDIDVLLEGNYEPNKNIEETITRAKIIAGKKDPVIVWFGRSTKEFPKVVSISSPPLQEIPILYNRAKTFLKMSIDEGWGRPVAEAKACGVPKIYNFSGGNGEVEVVSWEEIAKKLVKVV